MAAGLVHAITRSCSHGNMTECGCDTRLQGGGLAAEGWHWGGCSDHIQYGTWFSRKFIDNAVKNMSTSRGGYTLITMNQHNTEAGRQAIDRTMSTDCRCHGVSGSCAVKTCWRTMAPFERVGVYLKERYERSVQVSDRSRRKTRRKDQRRLPVDKHQLIFFNKSPNYCLEDRRRGVSGTRGRRCNRTSAGSDGCNLLCCGRGYNTHVVRHVQRCECKFVWCCYVRCRRCESMNDMHTSPPSGRPFTLHRALLHFHEMKAPCGLLQFLFHYSVSHTESLSSNKAVKFPLKTLVTMTLKLFSVLHCLHQVCRRLLSLLCRRIASTCRSVE
ncbi:protein Wnt-16 isoform X1 [Xiphias gladius]|uniref:protein Wnt-16 isoform X1 n=1 Tax=Xiphias gladius TaxID=8245 RepID=UPI001A983A67|nr:protein Wnt-16 isoform X1 [Xiphias gladius]